MYSATVLATAMALAKRIGPAAGRGRTFIHEAAGFYTKASRIARYLPLSATR